MCVPWVHPYSQLVLNTTLLQMHSVNLEQVKLTLSYTIIWATPHMPLAYCPATCEQFRHLTDGDKELERQQHGHWWSSVSTRWWECSVCSGRKGLVLFVNKCETAAERRWSQGPQGGLTTLCSTVDFLASYPRQYHGRRRTVGCITWPFTANQWR